MGERERCTLKEPGFYTVESSDLLLVQLATAVPYRNDQKPF
jgi:hypothetical protein